jgi:hypothetical protein
VADRLKEVEAQLLAEQAISKEYKARMDFIITAQHKEMLKSVRERLRVRPSTRSAFPPTKQQRLGAPATPAAPARPSVQTRRKKQNMLTARFPAELPFILEVVGDHVTPISQFGKVVHHRFMHFTDVISVLESGAWTTDKAYPGAVRFAAPHRVVRNDYADVNLQGAQVAVLCPAAPVGVWCWFAGLFRHLTEAAFEKRVPEATMLLECKTGRKFCGAFYFYRFTATASQLQAEAPTELKECDGWAALATTFFK